MSLNLGLESLGIVTDDVSLESVYQAEAEFSDAQLSLERACFIVATEARNIANYNEVISSLQRHSSQECVEFAQDLLGTASLEKIAELPGTPAKKTFGEKAKGAWEAFKNFVMTCYNFIKKWTGKLLTKLHIISERGFSGEMKVHYTKTQLDEFAGISVAGSVDPAMRRKPEIEAFLKLGWLAKKAEKSTLKMEEADAYVKSLQNAQAKLWNVLRSLGESAHLGLKEKNTKDGRVFTTDQNFVAWFVGLVKRLKPFQKNIMADFSALMKRAGATASVTAGDLSKIAKKTKDGETISASKVAKAYGGEKENGY